MKRFFSVIKTRHFLIISISVIIPAIFIIGIVIVMARGFLDDEMRKKVKIATASIRMFHKGGLERYGANCTAVAGSFNKRSEQDIRNARWLGVRVRYRICEVMVDHRVIRRFVSSSEFVFSSDMFLTKEEISGMAGGGAAENIVVRKKYLIQRVARRFVSTGPVRQGMCVLSYTYDNDFCSYLKSVVEGDVLIFSGGRILASSTVGGSRWVLSDSLYKRVLKALKKREFIIEELDLMGKKFSTGFLPLFDREKKIVAVIAVAMDTTFIANMYTSVMTFLGTILVLVTGLSLLSGIIGVKKVLNPVYTLASEDGLTMIANRRQFDEFLALEIRRCARTSSPITLLMIDIDYFKLYNDNYGHLAGDAVLKRVASIIKESTHRAGDLAVRYGGEEFSVILSGTDVENGKVCAERIRSAIEALSIPHAKSKNSAILTVSIGVAAIIPDVGTSTESLIKAADRELYKAKETGRNRVCSR